MLLVDSLMARSAIMENVMAMACVASNIQLRITLFSYYTSENNLISFVINMYWQQ